jgi:NUMOD1 domain
MDLNTKESTTFDSIHAAARALGIRSSVIDMFFFNNQKKPYKGRYIFKKL